MRKSVNKYGLKRYVPSDIRAKIREDAGFGCVICGCVFVDYEHIEPEFSNAKVHCPTKMTLLCIDCHGRVTRRLISKKRVWDAKLNPKALQDGFVHDLLFVNTDEMEIEIGNSRSKTTKAILTIHGKPIIWFEPPILENEPSKLCAIFHNEASKASSYINRNQFVALTNNQDVKSESTELEIVSANKKCLKIDREGDAVLKIIKMSSDYLGTSINIDNTGALIVKQGEPNFTLSKFSVENCGSAINFGAIPSYRKYKKLDVAMSISNRATSILSVNSAVCGWKLGNQIFNKNYEIVGIVKDSEVYNICDEFIGNYSNGYIVYKDDCYESGEPIYISQENRNMKNVCSINGYDLSFRLFGNGI